MAYHSVIHREIGRFLKTTIPPARKYPPAARLRTASSTSSEVSRRATTGGAKFICEAATIPGNVRPVGPTLIDTAFVATTIVPSPIDCTDRTCAAASATDGLDTISVCDGD